MDSKLVAGEIFPAITVKKLNGSETTTLGSPGNGCDWQLIIIYRGVHCPVCTQYLTELNDYVAAFKDINVDVIAVSGDDEQKATKHMQEVKPLFDVAYGLTIDQMKTLGLYITDPRAQEKADQPYSEPAVFAINDSGLLQLIDISNAPFIRPALPVLCKGIQFIRDPERDYPIRGTYRR